MTGSLFDAPEEGASDGKSSHCNQRNFEYWQQIRKNNPRQYYSASTQKKVMADLERLGRDAFFKSSRKEAD